MPPPPTPPPPPSPVHDTDHVLLEEIHSSWHAGSHSAEIGQARRELQPTNLEDKNGEIEHSSSQHAN